MKMEKENENEVLIEQKKEPKTADQKNVNLAKDISKLPKLKTFVDKLMSSVNKETKKGVKEAADKLIGACKDVANKLDIKIQDEISEEEVKKFSSKEEDELGAYDKIVKDLAESSDKKDQKLVTSMSNAFPHWCLSLAQKLQSSNFYKRLSGENNKNEDNGKTFDVEKKEKNKGVIYGLKKKYKNLFSGKSRKHETFNKMKNLVVRYSEPWAVFWVNTALEDYKISESSMINEINKLLENKDSGFLYELGEFFNKEGFQYIFNKEVFSKNSGKIKKSLDSIIKRLASISNKLKNEKYSDRENGRIKKLINGYEKNGVLKEFLNKKSVLSKVLGAIVSAAKTVGSGIVKGGKLLGKGALAVATSPKYIFPKKIRNEIYKKLHKKKEEEPQEELKE